MPLMLTQEALHCLKPNCWAANAQNLPLDSIPFQYDEASCPLLLCPELAGPTHEPHWCTGGGEHTFRPCGLMVRLMVASSAASAMACCSGVCSAACVLVLVVAAGVLSCPTMA